MYRYHTITTTTAPHFVVDKMKTKWTFTSILHIYKKILSWYLNILTKETSKQKITNKAILSNKSFRFNTGSFILHLLTMSKTHLLLKISTIFYKISSVYKIAFYFKKMQSKLCNSQICLAKIQLSEIFFQIKNNIKCSISNSFLMRYIHNSNNHHDITEILLKVVLNTINHHNSNTLDLEFERNMPYMLGSK